MSIILNGTTESLKVVLSAAPASTQLAVTASWADQGATSGDSSLLTTGTTAVTVVAAPAAGVSRWVGGVSVYNQDTAAATVTVQKLVGATAYTLFKGTIQSGNHLFYDNACGWRVVDASGAVVTTTTPTTTAPVGDGVNLLIDGGILVNQSGFAGGSVAAGVYGYDMWKGGTGGGSLSVNASTGVITHTSGAISQVMESPGIASQQVTISVEDPSGSVTVGVDGVTGTITAGSGRRGVTINVPSGSTGNPVFTISATGVTYSRIKLERGGVVTPWKYAKPGDDIFAVQRYYEQIDAGSVNYKTIGTAVGSGAVAARAFIRYARRKRVAPTVTTTTPLSFYDGSSVKAGTTTITNYGGLDALEADVNLAASTTLVNGVCAAVLLNPSASIKFDARL